MDKSYKNIYYDLEDKHWWNVSRREIIIKLLNPYFKKKAKVLDIGCSSGALIKQIISNNVVNRISIDYKFLVIRKYNYLHKKQIIFKVSFFSFSIIV